MSETMKLGHILEGLDHTEFLGNPEDEIRGVVYDSRLAGPGYLFVALRGHRENGHRFIRNALDRGASAVVAEEIERISEDIARVRVPDSRKALSKIALRFYRNPFEGLSVIGITGTNGKTTTAYLLESILKVAGARPGVMGTINYRYGGKRFPAPVTTPESLDMMHLVREMADEAVTHVIMEVSSHALDQGRTQDCPFKVAVFTNLSRDHLDYHKTMEEYFKAKCRLFANLAEGRSPDETTAVINLDDPKGEDLVSMTRAQVVTYGTKATCRVRMDSVHTDKAGISFRLGTPAGIREIHSDLLGEFNAYNIMAASAAAMALGIPLDTVVEGVEALKTVPGRLELVPNPSGLVIVVDYAHTPDALLKSLQALRPHVPGRIITVFGCGGDRDKGKRPDMGLVAGKGSEVVFITSDNPRSEDPLSIVDAAEQGVVEAGLEKMEWPCTDLSLSGVYFKEVDRRQAIGQAIHLACQEDLVLIAGKGHEDYQIIGNKKGHFSDQEEAALAAGGRV
jgi:UDP-N-acetylmuramoyl-L-alanyl-D-glutamate--2,6-diaminopimelate ligase